MSKSDGGEHSEASLPEHQIESRGLFAVPQQTISKHAQTILENII